MFTMLQAGESALIRRIRAEFLEMPDLMVTRWQATRLWNLDPLECGHALETLVRRSFLTETRHGAYRRANS